MCVKGTRRGDGYRSDNLEFLINVATTVAFCNERIDIYLARDLQPSRQHLDENEFLDVYEYSPEELCEYDIQRRYLRC